MWFIYDYLVNPEMLSNVRAGAEKIYVGKVGGGRQTPQNEINRLLVSHAQKGTARRAISRAAILFYSVVVRKSRGAARRRRGLRGRARHQLSARGPRLRRHPVNKRGLSSRWPWSPARAAVTAPRE